ncbi:MAG: phosphodiesterase [Clostridiales bacterium]|nr:phosphodiesterase [Clostridiales bacterium]
MKILFASDLHGSASACEKILKKLETENVDRFVLLGDLLYHGPRNDLPDRYAPKEVFAMLNQCQMTPLCVRGNCDAEVDQMVLEFPMMADYALLPLDGGRCAFVTHGHLFNTENPPPHKPGDVLIHGHTHVHCVVPQGDYTYINPGSTSLPKEGQAPSYMVYEDGAFEIRALDDDAVLMRWSLEA